MKQRICHLIGLFVPFLLLFATASCEKYEKVPENYPFLIRAEVTPSGGGDAVLSVYVTEGVHSGDCVLSVTLDGAPFSGISMPDGEKLSSSSKWTFRDDGTAAFMLSGLPAGSHELNVSVVRWYHTASCKTIFNID